MNTADLKVICDLVHSLTVLRLQGCSHLCIENYAPELFGKLLDVYRNGGLIVTGSDISRGAMMETIETPTGKIHCGSTPIKNLDEGVPTGGWWHAIHFLEGTVTERECPRCGAPLSTDIVESTQ